MLFSSTLQRINAAMPHKFHLTTKYRLTGLYHRSVSVILMLLICGLASASFSHAQQAQLQPRTEKTRKATLQELYAMFFTYAVHVETVSDADEKLGIDRTFYRWHLQKASGLTIEEYSEVLASAKRFVATTANPGPLDQPTGETGVQPPTPGYSDPDSPDSNLSDANSAASLQNEISRLRETLGQERADLLDSYLQNDYATHKIISTVEDASSTPQALSNATPANVTIDGGNTCGGFTDNYGVSMSICEDSQMSYLGPGSWVELYSAGSTSSGNYTSVQLAGILSVNGSSTTINCVISAPPGYYGPGCTKNVQFTSGNGASYKWTTTITDYLTGGGYAWHWDPNPPSVTIHYPSIQSISPTSIYSPETTRLTLSGAFCGNNVSCAAGLISPFQNPPTVSDQKGACSNGLSEYSFNYSYQTVTTSLCQVSASAQPGTDVITVNNGFGSGTINITIEAPSPTITSTTVVGSSTNSLQAGPTVQTVTLAGQNFGSSAPTITIASGGTGVTIGGITAYSQSSVSFQVTVASDASAGTVQFELHVNDGAQNPNAFSQTISIAAMVPPVPSIYFNGANITNNTTQVVVGQQIYLSISLADGSDPSTIATSIDWTVPGIRIAGFTAFADINSGQIIQLTDTEQPAVLFYWLYPGSFTVNYTYCVDVEMQSCATAAATFNVTGPTGINMTATPGPAELFSENGTPTMSYGNVDYATGMAFVATMSAPGDQNSAFFVQLINYDNDKSLLEDGTIAPCNGPASPPALDHRFPYPKFPTNIPGVDGNLSTADSPSDPLDSSLELESQRLFSATMYLMWSPAGDLSPCSPLLDSSVPCAMPAPLGSITWTFAGDAINTLQIQNIMNGGTSILNDTTFVLNGCSGCTSPSMTFVPSSVSQPNYGYPTWTTQSGACSGTELKEANGAVSNVGAAKPSTGAFNFKPVSIGD